MIPIPKKNRASKTDDIPEVVPVEPVSESETPEPKEPVKTETPRKTSGKPKQKENSTDELEPVETNDKPVKAKSAPKQRKRRSRTSESAEELSEKPAASSRRRKAEPEKPKGPGIGAKIGKAGASFLKGIFLVFKYLILGVVSVFVFIGKRLKIRRLKKKMNRNLRDIGSALREKRNHTAFISESLAETASKLNELPEDSQERKKLILELGEKFLHDYTEHPDPAGIDRILKSTDSLEEELEKTKGKGEDKPRYGETRDPSEAENRTEDMDEEGATPQEEVREREERSASEEPAEENRDSDESGEKGDPEPAPDETAAEKESEEELKTEETSEVIPEVTPAEEPGRSDQSSVISDQSEIDLSADNEESETYEEEIAEAEPVEEEPAENDDDDEELELIDFPPPEKDK